MADISDVEEALVDKISAIVYPEGTDFSSIVGTTCRIYRGWPNSATLNADLSNGIVNITVASDNDSGHVTTRYWNEYLTEQPVSPLQAIVARTSITLVGSPGNGLLIGALVDGATFVCRGSSDDTPSLVAAKLAAAIRTDRPAILTGTTVTIPDAFHISARVATEASIMYEARRQEKDVRLIFWCPTPTVRDVIAGSVDGVLSGLAFLYLSDTAYARVSYINTATYDQSQNALLYRRDLLYRLEYPTMTSELLPAMLFGGAGLNGNTNYG